MRTILLATLVAALGASAVSQAHASCGTAATNKRIAGTVIGAVAGGLVGNAIAEHGGKPGGTIIGAAAGGYAGNQLTKSHCDREGYRSGYYDRRHHRHHRYASNDQAYADDRTTSGRCTYEDQPYYNDRAELVHRQVQVCR